MPEKRLGKSMHLTGQPTQPNRQELLPLSALYSGSIEPDASWSHTFSQAGTFPYYCTFHTEMKGTVIVK
jgi:plastocyanin